MGKRRIDLHQKFRALKDASGKPIHVYYEPPESIKLEYPCIIYSKGRGETVFGNDMPYVFTNAYDVLYVTTDPDDPLPDQIALSFQMITHKRHYVYENLHHDSYTIYY